MACMIKNNILLLDFRAYIVCQRAPARIWDLAWQKFPGLKSKKSNQMDQVLYLMTFSCILFAPLFSKRKLAAAKRKSLWTRFSSLEQKALKRSDQ